MAEDDIEGHWVTLEDGRHIFISGAAGHVPARLKTEGGANRFSKASLERKLVEHHNEVTGGGDYTAHDEKLLNEHSGGDPFAFHKKLPEEIKAFQAGRPELRKLFRVTDNAAEAGGNDAFGSLGDRYLSIAEAKAGSPVRAAKETARASNDPQVKFLAAVHDNLPQGRFQHDSINASGLRVGDKFSIGGTEFHVAEDAGGYRVLEGGTDYPETPVDALKDIPVDKGSFRPGKKPRLEAAPFSRLDPDMTSIFLFGHGHEEPALILGSGFPHPKTKDGQPCHYLWKEVLRPGTWRDARGKEETVTPQRIDTIISSFQTQKAKGVLPFVPPSHNDRSGDRNMGYIVEARKSESGSLELLHQLIGDDARLAASRNGTSICTLRNFKLQDGTVVPELIDHNAILPDPAIPNLKDFEPAIAASRGHGDAQIFTLASDRSDTMAKLSDEHRKRLEKVLPDKAHLIPDEPDNEYFVKLLESRADEHKTAMSRITAVETERDEAKRGLELARTTATAQPKPIDPEVLHERRLRIRTAIGTLNSRGFSKATTDALDKALCGDDKSPNTMMLSRENPADMASPVHAEKIIEILASNTLAPPTGTQSGIQLSRQVPGKESDEQAKEQEKQWEEEGKKYREAELEARGISTAK